MTTPTAPDQPPVHISRSWVPWLLVMVLFSLIVGMTAGILKSLSGVGLPEAVFVGGAAFGASMGLCLGAISAVRELRKSG